MMAEATSQQLGVKHNQKKPGWQLNSVYAVLK